VPLRRERELAYAIVGESGGNSHVLASLCFRWNGKAPTARPHHHYVPMGARIIVGAAASPSTNAHAAIILRSDVLRASKLFPHTDALLSWLLEDATDDAFGEQDRISFSLHI